MSQPTHSELVFSTKLEGNATKTSVNAICSIDSPNSVAFATGNADKSIRIWRREAGPVSPTAKSAEVDADAVEYFVSPSKTKIGSQALGELQMQRVKRLSS